MTFFDISRFSEKGFLASKGPSNTVVGLFRDVLGFVYMIYVSILVLVRLGLQIPSGCRNTLETSLKNVILTNFSPFCHFFMILDLLGITFSKEFIDNSTDSDP